MSDCTKMFNRKTHYQYSYYKVYFFILMGEFWREEF
jgi:hypothetical protein